MNIQKSEDESFYSDMGFRLKQIRQMKKVSQGALADALGVVKQTIQKYESGEIKMSPEVIQNCASVFDVSVGFFYGEDQCNRQFTRVGLKVASEVMRLPDENMQKCVYTLLKIINKKS